MRQGDPIAKLIKSIPTSTMANRPGESHVITKLQVTVKFQEEILSILHGIKRLINSLPRMEVQLVIQKLVDAVLGLYKIRTLLLHGQFELNVLREGLTRMQALLSVLGQMDNPVCETEL